MKTYLDILSKVLKEGTIKPTRTGINTLSITGEQFKHDMRNGFPLLTTKKMNIKNCATELEFFINGFRSKSWLQKRNCHIWDDWCNPEIIPYSNSDFVKGQMIEEDDLGRIYGVQWRNWNGSLDQLDYVIRTLNKNPLDRRMIVTAWNPSDLHRMALPPCHYAFQLLCDGEFLDLIWVQRSCDTPIGLPYDIVLYGLLLLIIAAHTKFKPRMLVGQLGDVHIYENQIELAKEQLKRQPKILPEVVITMPDLFCWKAEDIELSNYNFHPYIKYPIAI